MDINAMAEIINGVGFPIFTCIVLFWFLRDILTKFHATLETFSNSISANTQSIKMLCDKLEDRK